VNPVDKLIGGYLAFVTAVIVFRGGLAIPDNWWLIAAHLLFGVLLYLFTRLSPENRLGGVIHDLYPLILLPVLYAEIGVLNLQLDVADTFARDVVVQRWEEALFGTQISYTWIRAAPSVFWSGLLHLAYFAYYPIVLLGPLLLVARGKRREGRRVLLSIMVAFVASYVVFLLYPVAGPNYTFEQPSGPVREVWSARLVYWVLDSGSSFGAAFPSSHVAATVATILALADEWRALAALFVVPALLLVVGTVYAQMHYGVDTLAGLAVGVGAAWVGRHVA
jgi:membrane-associated phospholipid phosphatase